MPQRFGGLTVNQIIHQLEFDSLLRHMRNLTESDYQEVAESDGLNLVQWTASWCMPCKFLSPRLQELEEEGVFDYYKVDVDENSELAREFRIMSVPTLFLYKNGKHVHTMIGAKPKNAILEEIKDFR